MKYMIYLFDLNYFFLVSATRRSWPARGPGSGGGGRGGLGGRGVGGVGPSARQ